MRERVSTGMSQVLKFYFINKWALSQIHWNVHRLWLCLIHRVCVCVFVCVCVCVSGPMFHTITVIINAFGSAEYIKIHFSASLLHYLSLKHVKAHSCSNTCVFVCDCMSWTVWMLKCVTWGLVLVAVQQSRVYSVPQELANDACL